MKPTPCRSVAAGSDRDRDPCVAGGAPERQATRLGRLGRKPAESSPGPGRRRASAIFSASTTRLERMWVAIDQPTISRE